VERGTTQFDVLHVQLRQAALTREVAVGVAAAAVAAAAAEGAMAVEVAGVARNMPYSRVTLHGGKWGLPQVGQAGTHHPPLVRCADRGCLSHDTHPSVVRPEGVLGLYLYLADELLGK